MKTQVSPMLSKLHHVAIICSDYEKSKFFYAKILGLKIIRETLRVERSSMKLDLALPDGMQLELFSFPHAPLRVSRPEARGLRHLAFQVDNLDGVIRTLSEKGIQCEEVRVDELTGKKFTFFKDPDDLPLELYEA